MRGDGRARKQRCVRDHTCHDLISARRADDAEATIISTTSAALQLAQGRSKMRVQMENACAGVIDMACKRALELRDAIWSIFMYDVRRASSMTRASRQLNAQRRRRNDSESEDSPRSFCQSCVAAGLRICGGPCHCDATTLTGEERGCPVTVSILGALILVECLFSLLQRAQSPDSHKLFEQKAEKAPRWRNTSSVRGSSGRSFDSRMVGTSVFTHAFTTS